MAWIISLRKMEKGFRDGVSCSALTFDSVAQSIVVCKPFIRHGLDSWAMVEMYSNADGGRMLHVLLGYRNAKRGHNISKQVPRTGQQRFGFETNITSFCVSFRRNVLLTKASKGAHVCIILLPSWSL